MTQQPEWELVWSTDDRALYRDKTGVYSPELAVAQTADDADLDDIDATSAYVYRFPLDRCYRVTETDDTGDSISTESFIVSVDPSRKDLPHPLRSYRPWFVTCHGGLRALCKLLPSGSGIDTGTTLVEIVTSSERIVLSTRMNNDGGWIPTMFCCMCFETLCDIECQIDEQTLADLVGIADNHVCKKVK